MHAQEITIVASAKELDEAVWDDLVGPEVFASCGWLKTMEETSVHPLSPRYVLAHRGGRLIGGAVCYHFTKKHPIQTLNEILLGRFQAPALRAGISFMPALVCSPFYTSGAHVFVTEELIPAEKTAVVRAVLEAVETEARCLKAAVVFPGVQEHEADLVEALQEKGYPVTVSNPQAFIEPRWGSFDEYLAWIGGISRSMPKNIRRERNRNRKAGVTYRRLEDPNGYSPRLMELFNRNYQKHGRGDFAYTAEFFSKIKEHLGDDAVITLAEKEGQVIGASIYFRKQGVAHGAFLGVDHETAGNDYTYFNLGYYHMLEEAVAENIRVLHFGAALYEPKARRGCRVFVPLLFHKPYHALSQAPVRAWFRLHAHWYRRKLFRDLEAVRHYPAVVHFPPLEAIRRRVRTGAAEKNPAQVQPV